MAEAIDDRSLGMRAEATVYIQAVAFSSRRRKMLRRRPALRGSSSASASPTFRATGITAYLEAGGTLENAQAMAAHESPRTTKLYDRTGDEITLDEVERITI
jgi:hypothetical protein